MPARALRLLVPHRKLAAAAAVMVVLATLGSLAGPAVLRYAIDHGLKAGRPDLRVVARCSALFLGLALAAAVLSRAHTELLGAVGERVVRDLRDRVFDHVMRMSARYFDRTPAGVLVSRMTSDIDALEEMVQLALLPFVQSTLTLLLLVGVLFALSPALAAVSLAPMPALAVASVAFRRRSRRAYLTVRERTGRTLSTMVESLAGIKVVQAFGQDRSRLATFLGENDRLFASGIEAIGVQARFLPVVEATTALSTVLALGGGGWLVSHARVSLGTVSAFILYLLMIFEPVQSLSFLFNTVQSAAAALDKIFGLLDTPVDVADGPTDLPARAALSLSDVEFGYGDGRDAAVTGISITLSHGERLALVGPSGAGKSTLAKLMARLYDPMRGAVLYGGVDLRRASHRSLRRRIVLLSQEGHLFHGSVAENLRAVRPQATDSDLETALRRVGALERFAARPQGLASPVGNRGMLLSSGERQLLALARVALLDADVFILDEATASLDPATEAQVNAALDAVMVGRTVVLIAHRLSSLERVDRVAVVANGRIAELGSHEELIACRGAYAALHNDWLRSGERA
jgi:ATP-binding cassette subfamily B protein